MAYNFKMFMKCEEPLEDALDFFNMCGEESEMLISLTAISEQVANGSRGYHAHGVEIM